MSVVFIRRKREHYSWVDMALADCSLLSSSLGEDRISFHSIFIFIFSSPLLYFLCATPFSLCQVHLKAYIAMALMGRMCRAFEVSKPYIAMISLQFGYAGMNIITKVSLNGGMSHYVLVVYRHAVATLVIAPFAFFLERKGRPNITFSLFCQIFVLGLLGPVIDQNFYYAGLKLTTPTFSCAMSNTVPAMTFILAAIFRMEKLHIKTVRGQAKMVGTIISVGGAMLMTLYKGPIVHMLWSPQHGHDNGDGHGHGHGHHNSHVISDKDWTLGSLLLLAASLAWAGFFVLQASVLKRYSAQLSLTTLICFMGTLQSTALTFAVERSTSVWTIGWNIDLLAAVYAGVVTSGIAIYVQGLCMKLKGPVFATAFSPLMMILVAFMGSLILSEDIFLGSVLGGVVIVVGLYAVLWGKLKDQKSSTQTNGSLQEPPISQCKDAMTRSFHDNYDEYALEAGHAPTPSKLIGP